MDSIGDRRTKMRWTADTKIALLLALRLHGAGTAACREIGRPLSSVALRRCHTAREPEALPDTFHLCHL